MNHAPTNRHVMLILAVSSLLPGVQAAETASAAAGSTATAAPVTLTDAVTGGEAHLEFRYRIESVEQEPFADDALASILRSRLNYRTREWQGWSAFVEADNATVLGDDEAYNSTNNGVTDRPTIADPEYTEVNQAFVQFKAGALTAVAGRQRLVIDDQRFVGGAAWRHNEQTFDAITLKGKPSETLQLNYSWIANVNRIYGPESETQVADFHGSMHALNGSVDVGPLGALTAYAYLFDIDNSAANSTQTFGVQWTGSHALSASSKLNWIAAYANQRDGGDNPEDYSADYYRIEGGATRGSFAFKAGYEVLGGSDAPNQAFQTPLASLHIFQGWADKFLTTPTGGVEDLYVGATGTFGPVALVVTWHDFEAEAFSQDYGSEWNASAVYKFGAKKNFEGMLKFADYQADGFASDTTKVWFQFATTF